MLTVCDILADPTHSVGSVWFPLLRESLTDEYRVLVDAVHFDGQPTTAQQFRAGGLADMRENSDLDAVSLINSGLLNFDFDNPLHFVSRFHPNRGVRLSALKLARKLDINVTEVCNFKCAYCYQRSRDDDWESVASEASFGQLPLERWRKLLEEAGMLGVKRVKFTGGEPFTKAGFMEILAAAFSISDFEEIEICTNLSLLEGVRLERLLAIAGDGERLHFHVSLDGLSNSANSRTSKTKLFSQDDFERLWSVLAKLPKASYSVNSMWTSDLLGGGGLSEIHDRLCHIPPTRWSLSLPYLVKDAISGVQTGMLSLPTFDQLIAEAKTLIATHVTLGLPFPLSIPLVWKHEVSSEGFAISVADPSDLPTELTATHPCFPCHGSYFIIGPGGNVYDCLLLSRSQTNVRESTLADIVRAGHVNNAWYNLSIPEVAKECKGCRYEQICRGQCPNDRWNAGNGQFGRDLSACSLLRRAESEIWESLPENMRADVFRLIDEEGTFPAGWTSIASIVAGEEPILPEDPRSTHERYRQYRPVVAATFHTA